MATLNDQQLEAVSHGTGPLLIIAGAGTGKTTVVTKRIEHLILEKNVSPSNILSLTFTEKAAAEMQTRIDEIMPYGYADMWIETFHAFCDRLLRENAIHIGLSPTYQLMTEAQSLLFLKKNLFSLNLTYFAPLGNPTKFLQGLVQHFSRLKDDDISQEDYAKFSQDFSSDTSKLPDEIEKIGELSQAYALYEKLKAENDVMDFSDLISNSLKLLRERPHILKKYQEKFKFILVDEFQDTNYAQNELAILLSGEEKNITVVGDDDQSIYRWRGAALSNMLQFRSHFPDAKVVSLTKNYRSSQTILNGAYKLIQNNNPYRLEVKEGIDKKLRSMVKMEENKIELIVARSGDEEAEQIVKKIIELKKTNGFANRDFAILVRANDHATPFQRTLDRAQIEYQFLGPTKLYEQAEIKDLIAFLHALINFDDNSSLYRVCTMPIFDLDARDITMLLTYTRSENLTLFQALERHETLPLTKDGHVKTKKVLHLLKTHMQKLPKEDVGQILYSFFETSGLLAYYLDPKTLQTEAQAENVASFFNRLTSFSNSQKDASVFAAVEWLNMAIEMGESPSASNIDTNSIDAVNILTVHSSKGLEFPVVFVVSLVTQRFPGRDRKEQIPVPQELIRENLPDGDENLQEERRLFYVAMTRAKSHLYLTAALLYPGGKRERKLSPFITEALGDEEVVRILEQNKHVKDSSQLSLLEIANDVAANTSPKTDSKATRITKPITYISYSQLQTFDVCPLHFKLRYILNVPSAPSPALSYGISVHSALRDFFFAMTTTQGTSASAIEEMLKKNWLNKGYSSKSHEEKAYDQALKMLRTYAADALVQKPNTIGIEVPFQFWLNKVKVGGRIDRIDQLPNGEIEVIDYKTGPNAPDEKKLKDDFQLTFYALAANEVKSEVLNRDPQNVTLSLTYLELGKTFSTRRTMEDLITAKEKILTKIEEISQSDFECSRGILCKNCEYSMICNSS
ncbi:MAG: ATP-dependent helicase [Candidatus Levybacteria bacterium]|nr:ATP-dependent helicase [Candidatus Levybacteria bacterium]